MSTRLVDDLRYVQFDLSAFFGDVDVEQMNYNEKAYYLMVLLYCYRMGGSLPNDPALIARRLGVRWRNAESWWNAIQHMFIPVPGRPEFITQKRVLKEIGKVIQKRPDATPVPAPIENHFPMQPQIRPSLTADLTSSPLYADWKRLFNRYPKNPKIHYDGRVLSKWLTRCAADVNTPELVQKLSLAIDIYTAEWEGKPESERKFIKRPDNFICDEKKNERAWLNYADNAEEISASTPKHVEPPSFKVEKVPWHAVYGASDKEKARVDALWPADERENWIADQLAGVPPEHHDEWYRVHQLERAS